MFDLNQASIYGAKSLITNEFLVFKLMPAEFMIGAESVMIKYPAGNEKNLRVDPAGIPFQFISDISMIATGIYQNIEKKVISVKKRIDIRDVPHFNRFRIDDYSDNMFACDFVRIPNTRIGANIFNVYSHRQCRLLAFKTFALAEFPARLNLFEGAHSHVTN